MTKVVSEETLPVFQEELQMVGALKRAVGSSTISSLVPTGSVEPCAISARFQRTRAALHSEITGERC